MLLKSIYKERKNLYIYIKTNSFRIIFEYSSIIKMEKELFPSLERITIAYERIKPYIEETPLITNKYLNDLVGATIYFKCENMQNGGAFKARGAANALLSLD